MSEQRSLPNRAIIAASLVIAVLFPACGDSETDSLKQPGKEASAPDSPPASEEEVDDRWGSFATTESGLKYKVLQDGADGPSPNPAATVRVKYTGFFEDGKTFDRSDNYGPSIEFPLCRAIPWWTDGVRLMTVGSRFEFVVPPHLAYGAKGNPPLIPPDATLIYEVELVDFDQGPELPPFHRRDPAAEKKTGSGLVYEILEPGEGEAPKDGDLVEVSFAVWNDAKRLVDCSEIAGRPKRYTVGKERFRIFNEGAKLLRPGARCRFVVAPSLGYGSRGFGNLVSGDTETVWELELVKFVEIPRFTMPSAQELTTTESGLKYHVVDEGEGASPEMGWTVIVDYAGWLDDGTLFDSSYKDGKVAEFELGRVIAGWNEGMQLMKEGAVYIFVIPPELGYGARGAGKTIPPNATLVFHVELLEVEE